MGAANIIPRVFKQYLLDTSQYCCVCLRTCSFNMHSLSKGMDGGTAPLSQPSLVPQKLHSGAAGAYMLWAITLAPAPTLLGSKVALLALAKRKPPPNGPREPQSADFTKK